MHEFLQFVQGKYSSVVKGLNTIKLFCVNRANCVNRIRIIVDSLILQVFLRFQEHVFLQITG